MTSYRAVALTSIRAVGLIGILPGAIVAAAYLFVLTGQLVHHWDARTAVVFGMAAWGVLGVVELWHEYVRLSRNRVGVESTPVSPRAVLFVWALILLAVAAWRTDTHPWMAGFLALVALYSLGRAFGLLKYVTRPPAALPRTSVTRSSPGVRAGGGDRSRASRTSGIRENRPPERAKGR
jgi:TRAP-type uncharacterized transport system fused permease subunit